LEAEVGIGRFKHWGRTSKASPLCFRARVTTEGVALSVVAAEMRAIELDALHGGIGCGL
jgi:hypothetical protein